MNENIPGDLSVDRIIWSPNADDRPCETEINMLVIHSISLPPNEFEKNFVDDFFTNRLDVSAHPYFLTIAHLRVSALWRLNSVCSAQKKSMACWQI
jgi:AmpD protein